MRQERAFTFGEVVGITAIVGVTVALASPFMIKVPNTKAKGDLATSAKALSSAILAYTVDNEGSFPCGTTPDLSNPAQVRYRPTVVASQSPVGWFRESDIEREDQLVWNNAIAGYLKKAPESVAVRQIRITDQPWLDSYDAALLKPVGFDLTYNGMLQYLPAGALEGSSPLLWQGLGDASRPGAATANPRLNCNGEGPCRFDPNGAPESGSPGNGVVMDVVLDSVQYAPKDRSNLFVSFDGSARPVYFGRGNKLPFAESLESSTPFASLEEDGTLQNPALRTCALHGRLYVTAFLPFGKALCSDPGARELRAADIRPGQSGR